MHSDKDISLVPELLKKITHTLPVRRSQLANWGVRLLNIKKPFWGRFMGLPMEIHPLESASRSAYFLGFYEREVTIWALDYFGKKQPAVVFDIGANFGYFIYLAITQLKRSTIYGFEPDPYNLAWLQRNLDRVKTSNNLVLEKLAISDKTGTVKFIPSNPSSNENLWAGMNLGGKPSTDEIEVPATSLDAYCRDHNLKSVDLVKIDIEGAEGFTIDGMRDGIKNHLYKNVLLELHPHLLKGEHAPNKLIATFVDAGYSLYQFQPAFNNGAADDKVPGFYDMTWKPSYLKKLDPKDIVFNEWEHVLLSVEG